MSSQTPDTSCTIFVDIEHTGSNLLYNRMSAVGFSVLDDQTLEEVDRKRISIQTEESIEELSPDGMWNDRETMNWWKTQFREIWENLQREAKPYDIAMQEIIEYLESWIPRYTIRRIAADYPVCDIGKLEVELIKAKKITKSLSKHLNPQRWVSIKNNEQLVQDTVHAKGLPLREISAEQLRTFYREATAKCPNVHYPDQDAARNLYYVKAQLHFHGIVPTN